MIMTIFPLVFRRNLCTEIHKGWGFGILIGATYGPHFHKNQDIVFLDEALKAAITPPKPKKKGW